MGVNLPEITEVFGSFSATRAPRRILDIGTQNVVGCTAAEVMRFVRDYHDVWQEDDLRDYAEVFAAGAYHQPGFGSVSGAWLGDLLTRAGMEYAAYDIFDGPHTTIFDLNKDSIPPLHRQAFDIVLNCGTTEHVLNQYNCLQIIHDAVRVGGLMYHALPMVGYLDHGYFCYTPLLFRDLAKSNNYEIVKIDYFGPQGQMQISEAMFAADPRMADFAPDATRAADWHDAPIRSGLFRAILRRRSAAPFQPCIETATTVGPVAEQIGGAYGREAEERPATRPSANHRSSQQRQADRELASALGRFEALTYADLCRLCDAQEAAYPGRPVPPLLERRALLAALAEHPQRQDLRTRLAAVEHYLHSVWPLFRIPPGDAPIDPTVIAEDGIEAALLALPAGKQQFNLAVTAFHRYLDRGFPERFPDALEFRALRYMAEVQAPADWSIRERLGDCARRLSPVLRLRRRG